MERLRCRAWGSVIIVEAARERAKMHSAFDNKKAGDSKSRSGQKILARPAGLEPATVGLEVRCSIR